MEISIEKIYKLLENQGLSPKFIKKDGVGFSRWIEFKTKYQICWIKWYINYSTLRVGDRYGIEIPFTSIKVMDTYPGNTKCLEFGNCEVSKNYGLAPLECYLVLEKLPWQEEDLELINQPKETK